MSYSSKALSFSTYHGCVHEMYRMLSQVDPTSKDIITNQLRDENEVDPLNPDAMNTNIASAGDQKENCSTQRWKSLDSKNRQSIIVPLGWVVVD